MKIIHGSLSALLTEVKERGKVDGVRVAAMMQSTFEGAGTPRYTSWVIVSGRVDWESWAEWRLVVGRPRTPGRARAGWSASGRPAPPTRSRTSSGSGDFWGEICGSREIASAWADRLVPIVELAWSPDPECRGFFHGTTACLSALLRAGRYEDIFALLEKAPVVFWPYRQ